MVSQSVFGRSIIYSSIIQNNHCLTILGIFVWPAMEFYYIFAFYSVSLSHKNVDQPNILSSYFNKNTLLQSIQTLSSRPNKLIKFLQFLLKTKFCQTGWTIRANFLNTTGYNQSVVTGFGSQRRLVVVTQRN